MDQVGPDRCAAPARATAALLQSDALALHPEAGTLGGVLGSTMRWHSGQPREPERARAEVFYDGHIRPTLAARRGAVRCCPPRAYESTTICTLRLLLLPLLLLLLVAQADAALSPSPSPSASSSASASAECDLTSVTGDKCAYIEAGHCQLNGGGFVDYLWVHYCLLAGAQWASFILMIAWMVYLFYVLMYAASLFSVVLAIVANIFRLSPEVAGVTLLALGNGAPDFFTALAGVQTAAVPLIISGVAGAGLFVTVFVFGWVLVLSRGGTQAIRSSLIRDTILYGAAVLGLLGICIDGRVYVWEMMLYLATYAAFVGTIVANNYIQQSDKARRRVHQFQRWITPSWWRRQRPPHLSSQSHPSSAIEDPQDRQAYDDNTEHHVLTDIRLSTRGDIVAIADGALHTSSHKHDDHDDDDNKNHIIANDNNTDTIYDDNDDGGLAALVPHITVDAPLDEPLTFEQPIFVPASSSPAMAHLLSPPGLALPPTLRPSDFSLETSVRPSHVSAFLRPGSPTNIGPMANNAAVAAAAAATSAVLRSPNAGPALPVASPELVASVAAATAASLHLSPLLLPNVSASAVAASMDAGQAQHQSNLLLQAPTPLNGPIRRTFSPRLAPQTSRRHSSAAVIEGPPTSPFLGLPPNFTLDDLAHTLDRIFGIETPDASGWSPIGGNSYPPQAQPLHYHLHHPQTLYTSNRRHSEPQYPGATGSVTQNLHELDVSHLSLGLPMIAATTPRSVHGHNTNDYISNNNGSVDLDLMGPMDNVPNLQLTAPMLDTIGSFTATAHSADIAPSLATPAPTSFGLVPEPTQPPAYTIAHETTTHTSTTGTQPLPSSHSVSIREIVAMVNRALRWNERSRMGKLFLILTWPMRFFVRITVPPSVDGSTEAAIVAATEAAAQAAAVGAAAEAAVDVTTDLAAQAVAAEFQRRASIATTTSSSITAVATTTEINGQAESLASTKSDESIAATVLANEATVNSTQMAAATVASEAAEEAAEAVVAQVQEAEEKGDTKPWNRERRILIALNPPFSFLLAAFANNQMSMFAWADGAPPIAIWVALAGVALSLAIWFTTTDTRAPRWWPLVPMWGFGTSIIWIFLVANELVDLLEAGALVFGVSQQIVGLTVLAFGNSFGDFVADTTIARRGAFVTAVAGAFTGPILNLLVSISLALAIGAFSAPDNVLIIDPPVAAAVYIAWGFLLLGLVLTFSVGFLSKFRYPRIFGYFMVALYIVALTIVVLTDVNIIPA